MSDAWKEGPSEPASSQRSEEPREPESTGPSAAPGELAGLVTPGAQATPEAEAAPDAQAAPAAPWSTQAAQAPQAPAKKSSPLTGILVRVGIVAAIVIGGLVIRDRLSSAATDLRVGDCFDEPSTTATEVTDVQLHPCNESHDGEIFFVADYPAQDAYPGEDAFEQYIITNCVPAFAAYIGRAYESGGEYDLGWFYPTPTGWPDGDHEVSCYAYRLDGQKLTQSIKAGA